MPNGEKSIYAWIRESGLPPPTPGGTVAYSKTDILLNWEKAYNDTGLNDVWIVLRKWLGVNGVS